VFVAIDRATRFVNIEIIAQRDAATCLQRFFAAFPHSVHTILTRANVYRERQALTHGSEFTDRFGAARWQAERRASAPPSLRSGLRPASHRASPDKTVRPQTNGLARRFNRRLAEAVAARPAIARNDGKNKFTSHAQRNAFLYAFVADYNRNKTQMPQ
jgi:hypothetical protein